MGRDDPTNHVPSAEGAVAISRKAAAKYKPPPMKAKPSAQHGIPQKASLKADVPQDQGTTRGPVPISTRVTNEKRGQPRPVPRPGTIAIHAPPKSSTSEPEPPFDRKAESAGRKVDPFRHNPGEPTSRKRKRVDAEEELAGEDDDDDDQLLAHSVKKYKRKSNVALVVSDSEPERNASSHKRPKTKEHTAAHERVYTAADDHTMVDADQLATDEQRHAGPKPKDKGKGKASSKQPPANLKVPHLLGLANKLPNNWKDELTRSAHLEPLRIGILITQALYDKARLTIETVNFLEAQDDRAAQEHARQGLPPPPPLLTRRALVELRNELIGIIAPDPSQELMGGAYKRYRIDTSALEYAQDSANEIVRIPCLATKRSSTPTDDAGDDDVEPLGLTPPHTVGQPMDEDDHRYAVAEDTQQGSSDAESYTRRARYASPEVPYIGQAVAEDHTSQQSYAPSTSQE